MNRDITLGGETWSVPPLPLGVTRRAYPLCRKLTNAGVIDRAIQTGGVLDVTEAEMDDLLDAILLACQAAQPDLSREAFLALAASPPELLDAFVATRYQTGGWKPAEPAEAPPKGEALGAETPPT